MRIKSLFFVRLILSMQHFTRHFYATAGVPETRQIYLAKTLEEKRKLYRCKENYVQLKEIPTWPEFYQKNQIDLKNKKTPQASFNGTLNNKIAVFTGDITCLEIDSIVNAANNRMLGGGGVDGAIHKAAGSLLYDECKTLNGCKTGEAKITAGYNLPAKYVIHTVGPQDQNPDDLRNSYLNSLKLAIENKCRTIAFPCISTGVYGYPNEKAAQEVSGLIRNFLESNAESFDRIIFCLFMKKDIDLYSEYLQVFFPIQVDTAVCEAVVTSVNPPKIQKPSEPDVVLKINSDEL